MKKFLFAVALGLLSFVPVAADEPRPAPAPAPTPIPAPTVIGTTSPSNVIYSSDTGTTRRGLFGRLRNRNTMRSVPLTSTPSVPATGTIITTPGTGGTVVPAPMPPVITPRPSGATDTSKTTPAVTGNPVIVAGGTVVNGTVVPAGGTYMMTADGQIILVGGMMRETMPMSMTVSSGRMSTGRTGLIARLRSRR